MNQAEFMNSLRRELASLPEHERYELIWRCEECFRTGLLQGKTEEQIAAELGSGPAPEPAAPQAPPSYESNESYEPSHFSAPPRPEPLPLPPKPSPQWSPPPREKPTRDVPRIVGVSLLLLFLNAMLAIPLLASVWAAFVSLCAAAVGTLLSPIALVVEHALYGDYTTPKLFLALGMVGIGMLLAGLVRFLGKWLWVGTSKYAIWNYKTLKGRPR